MRIRIIVLLLFISYFEASAMSASVPVTDSVPLTISGAEELFLKQNYALLAAKYNVDADEAAIIQARLYSNPSLSFDQGAYNKSANKWFDVSKNGESAASLQQLILLGGKRKEQIKLATINAQRSSFVFYDFVKNLRNELHSTFYSLYFNLQSIAVYNQEVSSLDILVNSYNDQYNKGNVAFKELARLQSLKFSLENDRLQLLKETSQLETKMALFIGDSLARPVIPIVNLKSSENLNPSNLVLSQLLDSALINRQDLKQAEASIAYNETNLHLQKALRVPDLTLGANWDKNGSYINNYNSLSVAFTLPFFDRNQGNIKAAKYLADAGKEEMQSMQTQIKSEVIHAYQHFTDVHRLYSTSTKQFSSDYDKLLDGITKGYQNHTINLLEFIDYYDTWKDSKIAFNQLQLELFNAAEELNLACGTILLNK